MITILVRTSNRPASFLKMYVSVLAQTYTDWKIIVAYDNSEALRYIPNHPKVEYFPVTKGNEGYFWNIYCNDLKDIVKDGWFFYLDDDDYLIDNKALERIAPFLREDEGLIVQYMRGKVAKPQRVYMRSKQIVLGKIGGGCLFLHAKHKNLAHWDGSPASDYRWIKGVSEKLSMYFLETVVTVTGGKGLGKI